MKLTRWGIGLAAAVCLMSTCASPSGAAQTTPPASPAVIAPLLGIFDFGATVGLPLACDAGGSILPSASSALTPIANELTGECQTLSTSAHKNLQEAIAASGGASAINPLVDPLLASLSSEIGSLGQSYQGDFGPVGPTVSGLGQTISFFEGSPT